MAKYKSKFISTSDMYRNKHKARKSAPTGCMVAIIQTLSIAALLVLALVAVF